ncbi:MAG: nuclear transport factor 2 family protein [Acidimicrobiia bacterium]
MADGTLGDEDRETVRSVLLAYARAIDANAVDDATSLFSINCQVNYALGDMSILTGRDHLREHLADTLSRFSATSHHISNIDVTLVGRDTAQSHCYLYAWHRFPAFPDKPDFEFWGTYSDRLVKADGRWLIESRRLRMAGKRNMIGRFEPVERR